MGASTAFSVSTYTSVFGMRTLPQFFFGYNTLILPMDTKCHNDILFVVVFGISILGMGRTRDKKLNKYDYFLVERLVYTQNFVYNRDSRYTRNKFIPSTFLRSLARITRAEVIIIKGPNHYIKPPKLR